MSSFDFNNPTRVKGRRILWPILVTHAYQHYTLMKNEKRSKERFVCGLERLLKPLKLSS